MTTWVRFCSLTKSRSIAPVRRRQKLDSRASRRKLEINSFSVGPLQHRNFRWIVERKANEISYSKATSSSSIEAAIEIDRFLVERHTSSSPSQGPVNESEIG